MERVETGIIIIPIVFNSIGKNYKFLRGDYFTTNMIILGLLISIVILIFVVHHVYSVSMSGYVILQSKKWWNIEKTWTVIMCILEHFVTIIIMVVVLHLLLQCFNMLVLNHIFPFLFVFRGDFDSLISRTKVFNCYHYHSHRKFGCWIGRVKTSWQHFTH